MSSISKLVFRGELTRSYQLTLRKFLYTTPQSFAGHSKWANIRHIKALKDGQKAAAFTRLARQIRLAVQEGGSSDPALNSSLRNLVEEALRKNMPMSTIQNTIKKCDANKAQLKKHIVELKILNKIYVVCTLYTDNFPALRMNLAPIVKKANGSFVDAMQMFDDQGIIEAYVSDELRAKAKTGSDMEAVCTDDAIDCGAEDVEVVDAADGLVNFICNPIELQRISNCLLAKGYRIEAAEHVFIPKSYVPNVSASEVKAYETFRAKLKAFEGVEGVFDNLEPSDEAS